MNRVDLHMGGTSDLYAESVEPATGDLVIVACYSDSNGFNLWKRVRFIGVRDWRNPISWMVAPDDAYEAVVELPAADSSGVGWRCILLSDWYYVEVLCDRVVVDDVDSPGPMVRRPGMTH